MFQELWYPTNVRGQPPFSHNDRRGLGWETRKDPMVHYAVNMVNINPAPMRMGIEKQRGQSPMEDENENKREKVKSRVSLANKPSRPVKKLKIQTSWLTSRPGQSKVEIHVFWLTSHQDQSKVKSRVSLANKPSRPVKKAQNPDLLANKPSRPVKG
ncbi:hypothetical protein Taro_038329 [Colocasia esculenta]|uniref:Uncharacterized protein n=1 Tax=Colocasia esculenta TaxID=4460 RepID=A0A843WFK0_COLES|nr:hypothetical protein [Colocasia esculenta]